MVHSAKDTSQECRSEGAHPPDAGVYKQRQDRAELRQDILAKRANVVILNAATTAGIDHQYGGF